MGRRGDFRYTTISSTHVFLMFFFRGSGEAILGTQRYLDDATRRDNIRDNIRDYPRTLHKHFTQALYTSTLSKHFTQALYTSTLSKHFIQALYQSTLSTHFIKVFLKHFRNTCQGITKVLRQGITTRYYKGIEKGITTRYYKGITTRY